MKVSPLSISEVSSTLLITLYARARESLSENPIINDPKAVEIIEIIKKEIAGSNNPIHRKILKDSYNPKLSVTMALRSRCFDRYVINFLSVYPQGTVINLGCGLDTRFYRTDNGTVTWYDIDFPEVIELRKRFMEDNSRHLFIGNSIMNPEWIADVNTGGPYLILAEDLFMYLTDMDVQGFFQRIPEELGSAEIVCEVTNCCRGNRMHSAWMEQKFRSQLGMTGGAVFSFGMPDSYYFERWSNNYMFPDEWTNFDARERSAWFNLFSSIEIFRKVQWTLDYRIGKIL